MKRLARGLLVAAALILLLVLTLAAFGQPLGPSLTLLFNGAFGDRFAVARTAVKATPLILTALGVVVAWRAGMYNIGGEGQFIVGGIAGAVVVKLFGSAAWPPVLATTLYLLSCSVGGAIWAGLAGWLHVKRGVQVVISTILLNFVAAQLLGYALTGPLQESTHRMLQTDPMPEAWMLTRYDRQMDLHSGTVYALLAALVTFLFLGYTKSGFKLRLVGANAAAARANWIDTGRIQIQAMMISGCLCGLAGGIEVAGIQERLDVGFPQQWGFLAIPVALLGGLHPLLTVLSALFFGALFAGSRNLAGFSQAGTPIVYVIQAVAVLGYVGLQAWSQRRTIRQEAA